MSDVQIRKYKYTDIKIHKYTNTASVKVAERPNMSYIFEKVMVQGPQKRYSLVSYVQIHKYKYTNTQIHKYTNTLLFKDADRSNMCFIFEKVMV